MGTTIIVRSTVDRRYLEKRSRQDLIDRIRGLHQALGTQMTATWSEMMKQSRHDLATEVLRLMALLPAPPEGRLFVGSRRDRADGQFYLEVQRFEQTRHNLPVVLRVASDAFDGNENRMRIFAKAIVDAYNAEWGETKLAWAAD